ncbi:hypothetical protein CEXT_145851 [Caerostris extrusa]|uniref:Uncharacterized protein n=1 Tax=Caerostris extrusa TaxID=172846 RepID=A0AAV4YDV5_CAEEX|nr:hypothetical protein CEXT_145851 [Caerostris extrusa]
MNITDSDIRGTHYIQPHFFDTKKRTFESKDKSMLNCVNRLPKPARRDSVNTPTDWTSKGEEDKMDHWSSCKA